MTQSPDTDALGLARLIRRGDIPAIEVLDDFLSRAAAINPQINAITDLMADQARAAIVAGLPDGPFTGVPFLYKQLVTSIAGQPTTAGSRLLLDRPAPADSEAVRRARATGLVIAGRTTTSEFGLSPDTVTALYGTTRNPWDLSRSAGGSSGGAAAAVAAGLLPMAHATDGGGSIRIPAACCGLFGLKPSRARITAGPEVGEGLAGFAVQGVVSQTVRDSAAWLDAVAGPMPGDPYAAPPMAESCLSAAQGRNPGRLRIAFSTRTPLGHAMDPEIAEATRATARMLETLGHQVTEAAPDFAAEAMAEGFLAIFAAQCAATLGRITGHPSLPDHGIEPLTRAMAEFGAAQPVTRYINHQQALHREARRIAAFYDRHDIWLTPTLAQLPPALPFFDVTGTDPRGWYDQLHAFSPFAWLCNITGQPAMSLPLAQSASGLPVGLHFAARSGAEPLLYALAGQLEQALPWAQRRPAPLV